MSPTADELAEQTGRPLKAGDVLVEAKIRPSHGPYFCEVVDPDVIGARSEGQRQRPYVEVRTLTPHGPTSDTRLVSKSKNVWTGIVREEERTDRPSLKER